MVDLKHKCLAVTARSKLTILKRLRAKKHPSSKAPLVGIHRIHMDFSPVADEVMGSLNPGVDQDPPEVMESLNSCEVQDLPVGPLSHENLVQELFPQHEGFEDDSDAFFECRDDADFEAAAALGLMD